MGVFHILYEIHKMKASQQLLNQVKELESYISSMTIKNEKISTSTVGWQIDHSLKVFNLVCKALQDSDPSNFKNNVSLIGRLLLALGYFPRGKAKAPKQVQPPELISVDDLNSQIKLAKNNITSIDKLDKNAHFGHPLFKTLDLKKAIHFLSVHTEHHLKIIRDILKA